MKFIKIIILFFTLYLNSYSQTPELKTKVEDFIKTKNAVIGIAILNIETGDSIIINGNKQYPMQSVYKFHLALAILDQIDKGKLSLNQKVKIKKSDLKLETWSPLRDKYPMGNIELNLSDIIIYSVSQSDNVACDILFRLIGGPKKVDTYIHNLGIKEISIKATEAEMHQRTNAQFTNWTKPLSAVQLLYKFYKGNILSKISTEFLLNAMINSSNDPKRIKGLLPDGTIVAHKTGSSGQNDKGITAALNDIGIVSMPNGKKFAIAVFVSNSKESEEMNPKIIAEITKMTWDDLSK